MAEIESKILFAEGASWPEPRVGERLAAFSVALIAVMLVLLGRGFYLQVVRGQSFLSAAEGNRVMALPIPAPRGIIYDMSGKALTENVASTDVVLDPSALPTEEHEGFLIERLPELVGETSPNQVRETIRRARSTARVVVLKKAISHEEVLALEAALPDLPGVRLASSLVRNYEFGQDLAHLVGYTSAVTADELESNQDLLPIDTTGKIGLEKFYERSLRGTPGAQYLEVDVAGRPQKDLGREEPVAGSDLQLALDAELQQHIMGLFREAATASGGTPPVTAGAVVALDPRDGAIRALVSFPSFDPNTFSQPSRSKEAQEATQATGQALFHRALDGAYPPGSTIKPFLAVAALEEGVITADTTVLSTGGLSIGVWNFPDWKAGGHGVTDLKKAIAESVNTFFYLITGGDETHTGLGVERATRYLGKFGWGELSGVDLPASGQGFLPSKAWKEETKGERWYIGDTYHLGIGQGDVLVTPLQLAQSTATLANGNYAVTAHVSAETSGKRAALPVSQSAVALVREGMRQTVTEGSGRRLSSFPIPLAGKTGTAQVGGDKETHAWFTSFGPYEKPELVVTVLLENAGEGDDVAVPFAEKIWQWWYENRYSG